MPIYLDELATLGMSMSLQKGPVPPIGGSPCTFIPGGSGHCPSLNGKNFAGYVNRAPPPPKPDTDVDFSAAALTK
ncbi:hypothetical protein Dsin_029828 [Dipteronia sinensis]|uniref:Uncharacterized protein n=1 Tax=Dipteronia sinensis TaxID=43782 RepID=A0AAD9ZUF6_9ROSI|nr:hypothetical protein Dsin_029828 [Dipteronia sinensis]